MGNWESICSVLSQRYVRHTRHLLPVLNNFYLLVNTEFFCCCDYILSDTLILEWRSRSLHLKTQLVPEINRLPSHRKS
ncbi:MAG: hypothetical protein V7L01_34810 [Nostoc sp.]|uniref:hypothetical protein n=1 Tax=Nostoc sp. TaxID=1180 RepID=UPI002FFAD6EB